MRVGPAIAIPSSRRSAVASGPFTSSEIADMVANNALAAMWDTQTSTVTLNGADVSQINFLSAGAIHLVQATGANQPLYTGAPAYNGWPSVAFTAANSDQLARVNTNLAAGDVTIITAQRVRTSGTTFIAFNGDALTTGVAIGQLGGLRAANQTNVTNHSDAAISTAAAEVWVARFLAANSVPTLWVNGVNVALGGAASVKLATTGAATLAVGTAGAFFIDMDWMFGAVFQSSIPDALATSITNRLKARLGL